MASTPKTRRNVGPAGCAPPEQELVFGSEAAWGARLSFSSCRRLGVRVRVRVRIRVRVRVTVRVKVRVKVRVQGSGFRVQG